MVHFRNLFNMENVCSFTKNNLKDEMVLHLNIIMYFIHVYFNKEESNQTCSMTLIHNEQR